jgi:DNA recombination protein RmuC
MEITPILLGVVVGAILAYLLFYVVHKSKSIARKEYNILADTLNESNTKLRLSEDRLKSQQELVSSIQQKAELKDSELTVLRNKTASLEASLTANGERLKDFTDQLAHQTQTNKLQQAEINSGQQQLAELRAQHAALLEKLNSHKQEILDIQKTAHLQFEKIAQQIFEEKSGKFTETNKVNIEALLKPLNENIDTFKKKVEETYDKESKQRFSLEEKVKDLIENTQKISQEANNLATALKGQVKKQGDWGETILERILEMSGLEKNREYFVQGNLKDDLGNNLRPDIIVRLPDDRNIIIDSKVSLNAYLRFSDAESKEEQDISIASHLQAINQHIDQLSSKKYDELTSTLDFVIMFIPIEPAYIAAVQADPELWAYAYTRRILLISPTNLIAVLKIIADLWKREMQNKNAHEIANEGAKLYDKFVSFIIHMEEIGKHLNKSQDAYIHALGQLKDGRGNLISRVQKLKKLGLKSSKSLPSTMLTADSDEEDEPGNISDAEAGDEGHMG